MPGLKVIAPYTAADYKGLLKSAIRDPNPIIFLENEILYGQSFPVPQMDDFTVPIGKAKIHRQGSDVTIVSFAIGMTYALKAAQALSEQGIEAEVIDLRTIRPMDSETVVASVKKTGRCITVEEGFPQSGIGAEIVARLMVDAFDYLDAPVLRITGKGRADAVRGQPRKARPADGGRRGRGGQERLLQVMGPIRLFPDPSRRGVGGGGGSGLCSQVPSAPPPPPTPPARRRRTRNPS